MGRPKRPMITLEGKARELMVRKWGESFLKMEEEASHIFSNLES